CCNTARAARCSRLELPRNDDGRKEAGHDPPRRRLSRDAGNDRTAAHAAAIQQAQSQSRQNQGARLPAASNGAKLTYDDTPPVGQRSTYGVVTEGATATGAVSNLPVITPL